MVYPRLAFGEVRMSITSSEDHAERVERISRLIFEYVQQMMVRELQHLDSNMVIEHLEIPPIQVSFESMDDEAIAQASTAEIYRALLQAL